MLTLILKAAHVLAAFVFLGGGVVSAWWKVRADRSGDARVIAWCQREIVLADWVFTVPSAVALPATGALLVERYSIPWDTPWIWWGFGAWAVAGVCWLPAAFLQITMRRLARRALDEGTPLPPEFRRANRIWMALGAPSFVAALFAVWVMIAKWSF